MELAGPMAPNDLLNGAERLFEGEIDAPEGLAVANGILYTGNRQGDILKIVDGKMVKITNVAHPCNGYWEDRKCGRVVGINFDSKGYLYAADPYYGIYKINVQSGKFEHLIKTDNPIADKMVRVANSVVVAKDGTIYWTASICTNPGVDVEDAVVAIFADGNGRLFKYDPVEKTNTVLMDKISFANGLALSPNEDFVIVSETVRCRILRYWLKGPNQGTADIFVDGLPGVPDNIHITSDGIFEVSLYKPRSKENPLPIDALGQYPLVRRFITRLLYYIEFPFQKLQEFYPNIYTGLLTHWLNNFDKLQPYLPKALMLVRLSQDGKIIETLQSTDKILGDISDIVLLDGYYYLGSAHNEFLGRVKKRV
ncbi:adipocyte plasma membrane-associated protein Hemomucin-like isoform X2 [Neocloeon triangulifer]|nr:adipocyte plasma membrane-associated protein Hemomucin-like isoform X2 [Neocloeon triangulifer]